MRIAILAMLLALGACSQKQISERDLQRQQQQDQVQLKRQELGTVAGTYRGDLVGEATFRRTVVLRLEVRDVPQNTEGVDPIIVPKLLGHLRVVVGSEAALEYTDAALVESEFTPATSLLYAVAHNEEFGRLVLRLEHKDDQLTGTWSASNGGAQGRLELRR